MAALSLTGCALAKEELQAASANGDEILGVLVTVGDQEIQEQDSLEGQTFSSMKELEAALMRPDIAEGTQTEDDHFVFEGVKGAFMGVLAKEKDGVPTTHFVQEGEIFKDVKSNINVDDVGTTYQQEATVTATPEIRDSIYVNPVYRRGDGSVYVELDNGGYLLSGMEGGGVYSKTLTFESTRTINGKKENWKKEFTIHIEAEIPAREVRLKEYNEKDEVLKTSVLSRNETEFTLLPETVYVLIEKEQTDGKVERSVLTWDEEEAEIGSLYVNLPYAGETGLMEYTTVNLGKEPG